MPTLDTALAFFSVALLLGFTPGPDNLFVLVQAASTEELKRDPDAYCLNWLLEEVSTSINTTAAGGNASLMTIG